MKEGYDAYGNHSTFHHVGLQHLKTTWTTPDKIAAALRSAVHCWCERQKSVKRGFINNTRDRICGDSLFSSPSTRICSLFAWSVQRTTHNAQPNFRRTKQRHPLPRYHNGSGCNDERDNRAAMRGHTVSAAFARRVHCLLFFAVCLL